MSLSGSQLHYFVIYTVAFVAFGFIGRWYLWPARESQLESVTLPAFLLYANFRVNRLMFFIPSFITTQLQKTFANTFEIVGCANSLSRTGAGGAECAQWS